MDKIDKIIKDKNQRIDRAIDNKQDSIKLSAMHRDAALFTASRLGTWKQASEAMFIKEHESWLAYFRKLYFPEDLKKVELEKSMRAKEIADPLNHIDITLEVNE